MARLLNALTKPGRRGHSLLLVALAFGLALATASGSLAQEDRPTVAVGSKNFTEQLILAELLALLLEDDGYEVERSLNLGGTAIAHQALVNGDIDTYVEYTGTGLTAILNQEVPTLDGSPAASPAGSPVAATGTPAAGGVAEAVYAIVKEAYQTEFNLVWLDSMGFNNTYTLALTEERAAELGVETISDLQAIAGDLTMGATQEFLTRPDGLPGLSETYDLEFGDARGFDAGLVYEAVDSGQVDVISAFATDGRIPALGLVTLVDDRGFFPPYFAAPVVRQELLDEDPAVADVLNQLAGLIDDPTMAGLNSMVDLDGQEPVDVARTFLQEQGLIG